MSTLIVVVLTGIVFAYFATQNAAVVLVNLLGNTYALPLYGIVLGSLLLGLVIAGIIGSIDSLSSLFEIRSRDSKLNQKQKTVEDLNRKIQALEIENTRLQTKIDGTYIAPTTTSHKARLFFQKLRGQIPA